jgi:hypothetical protein
MQAMMVSAEKTQAEMERKEKEASRLISTRKSGKKVRIQTPGQMQGSQMQGQMYNMPQMQEMQRPPGPVFRPSAIHTVLQRPLSNPVAGPPPPSASDYIPPTTFLQQMTNPQNTIVQPKSVPDYFKR